MALLIVQGVLPAVSVYLIGSLVDSLVVAIGVGGSWASVQPTFVLAILVGLTMLFSQVLQSVANWINTAQSEFIRDYLSGIIQDKSISIDMAFYESPEYYDRLSRAQSEAGVRPLALLNSIGGLFQNTVTLLAMGAILLPYGLWLPAVLLIATLPTFYVVTRFNHRYHEWWTQATADRRRTQYFDVILTNNLTAAEVRLFQLGPHFQTVFQMLRRRLRAERLQLTRGQTFATLGAGLLTVLITGLVMVWMVWRALQGLITLGELTIFYQAFNRGQGVLRSLLNNVSDIYTNTLFLSNLFEFLTMEPTVSSPPQPLPAPKNLSRGIQFEHITFCYPGSKRPALQDFSLTIPSRQVVAIVGANGAGKTTLLKLVCRFYDPEAGSIKLDGTDIRQLSIDDLRRNVTVLFQEPVRYQEPAASNIALGDLSTKSDRARIIRAAQSAGAHEVIERLPQQYDTQLGKWFANGTELSGGEWQRLALARAFYRQAPIMILDEPTSALDSWSEIDWYDRFQTLAKDRTAIIITHRFTTAMRADMIHVMDKGKIVESGTHAELLAQGGLYAQSWGAQMEAAKKLEGQAHSQDNGHLPPDVPQSWSDYRSNIPDPVPTDSDFSLSP